MDHVRGAPYHPMTQGKIERWHQTLKNRIFLKNYYLPGDLEAAIAAFVAHYNHLRYHESLGNLTSAKSTSDAAKQSLERLRSMDRNSICPPPSVSEALSIALPAPVAFAACAVRIHPSGH